MIDASGLYQSMMKHSNTFMALIDLSGSIIQLSDSWVRTFGGTEASFIGKPLSDLALPADRFKVAQEVSAVVGPRAKSGEVEGRFGVEQGVILWLRWELIADASGSFFCSTARDLTTMRSLRRIQSALEASPNGHLTIDESGTIVLVNRRVEQLFGYSREEILGKRVEMLMPNEMRSTHVARREHFQRMPQERLMGQGRDLFGQRKDGSLFPIEIGLSPVQTDEGRHVHCSVIDISERKKVETEMQVRVDELQTHRRQTELLGELSSLLQHAVSEAEAVAIVTSFAERLLPNLQGAFYVIPAATDVLNEVAVWGGMPSGVHLDSNSCWGLRRSQPHYSEPRSPVRCRHLEKSGWGLCIPMSAHGRGIGTLTVSSMSELVLQHAEQLAKSVADQFGLALTNIQLREGLRNLSIRDSLTGLFNRRFLEESAARELQRATRHRKPVSVVMLDIDHFKDFNDTHGHPAADEVLRVLARMLNSGSRAEDIACRYGGEEFTLVFPDCTLGDALERVESFRTQFSELTEGKVTFSAGIAVFPEDGTTYEVLVRNADSALYRAKSEGRNRVLSYWEPENAPMASQLKAADAA